MRNAVIVAMMLGFVACAESPTQVVDEAPALSEAMDTAGHGPVVGGASGSGHALCTDDGALCYSQPGDDALRTFSFTAQVFADGSARGNARFNNRGRNQSWDADVGCVYIRPDKPNQAWIGATLTRGYGQAPAPSGIPYAVGTRVIFAVEDNGEGSQESPSDRILGFGTADEAGYQSICDPFDPANPAPPPPALDFFLQFFGFDPIRGNIQVRSPYAS